MESRTMVKRHGAREQKRLAKKTGKRQIRRRELAVLNSTNAALDEDEYD
jgi:hypothetical protein